MTILAPVIKVLLSVLMSVTALISGGSTTDPANTPVYPDKCKLSFATVSDLHIHETDNAANFFNCSVLESMLTDMEASERKLDAVVLAGDLTDDGEEDQWQTLETVMSKHTPADNILLALGNHDTWTENGDKSYKKLFKEYTEKITGNKISNVYYSKQINGYYFIFLGSEKDSVGAYFSSKQLSWLKTEMAKAAKTEKPIFVVSHWPLNQTHGLPVTFGDEEYDDMTGGIGEQSAKVKKILNKYKNVFLISGHIHSGFSNAATAEATGYQSVETYGNITSINLPFGTFFSINGDNTLPGAGYTFEVYKTKVMIRARNYASGKWLPEYNYTVKLK